MAVYTEEHRDIDVFFFMFVLLLCFSVQNQSERQLLRLLSTASVVLVCVLV